MANVELGPTFRVAIAVLLVALLVWLAVAGASIIGAPRNGRPSIARPQASNGVIAVSASQDGDGQHGDLWLASLGTTPHRILGSDDDGIAQACPQFSPDGRHLAYGEGIDSGPVATHRGVWPVAGRAVVMVDVNRRGEPSGTAARVPVFPGVAGEIPCATWSPDSRSLAFIDGNALWLMDVVSGRMTSFAVAADAAGTGRFAWSRDASRVAVGEPGQIRVIVVAKGTSTFIKVPGSTPRSLGWTAGDRSIVYLETGPQYAVVAVRVASLGGTSDVQLAVADPGTNNFYLDPVVSPDGTRVAYQTGSGACSGSCNGNQLPDRLVVAGVDGAPLAGLAMPSGYFATSLLWSPDGRRVLCSSVEGLRSAATDGSGWTTYTQEDDLNVEWSYAQISWQPLFD